MKAFVVNLDVGSGVEYVGDVFLEWIKQHARQSGVDIIEYKRQTSAVVFTRDIRGADPDVVVVNEFYPRVIVPLLYYKLYRPSVRIFAVSHSWKSLVRSSYCHPHEWQVVEEFCRMCDAVITLSKSPNGRLDVDSKVSQMFMPVDPNEYFPMVPWSKRREMFGYLGGLFPNKFSKEFVVKVRGSGIGVNCHGIFCSERAAKEKECDASYENEFAGSVLTRNLTKSDPVPQSEVAKTLNRYKYFVMPHDGTEVFCITLLQAIMCGTIPIVVNDDKATKYDPRWIEWAEGMYFGCSDVDSAIKAMRRLQAEEPSLGEVSSSISAAARRLYDPEPIRKLLYEFIDRRNQC